MKASNQNIIAILVLSWALAGCGASKVVKESESIDLGSRANPEDVSGLGKLAECNDFADTQSNMVGYLSTYYDPATGYFINNYIRMALKNVPTSFIEDQHKYIQIFRWSEDNPGQRVTNQTAVNMYFLRRGTGQVLNLNKAVNTLSQSMISKLIADYGLASQGITPHNFFDSFFIVLLGMELNYDAISIAFYDSRVGNQAQRVIDALVPAFYANPNLYASTHPAASLQALHPMYDMRNAGWNDGQYFEQTEYLCQGFY